MDVSTSNPFPTTTTPIIIMIIITEYVAGCTSRHTGNHKLVVVTQPAVCTRRVTSAVIPQCRAHGASLERDDDDGGGRCTRSDHTAGKRCQSFNGETFTAGLRPWERILTQSWVELGGWGLRRGSFWSRLLLFNVFSFYRRM